MKTRKKTNRVIFHHSLSAFGDVEDIREWHIARGFEDIGYHYVILGSGSIEHGREIKLVGSHAYGKNSDSIGICLIGDFRYTEPTAEQIDSSAIIYHDICRYYSKKLSVEFHRAQWLPNACPGPMLDRDDFREILLRAVI